MTQAILHFVDLSIPGLSGRDLARKAFNGLGAKVSGRGLARLDRHQLRDIGLDRSGI